MSDQTIEERIAAARAKKEAAEAKRAALAAKRSLDDEARRIELAAENEAALAEAEEKIGPVGKQIATCETHDGIVIVKRPAALFWRSISRDMATKNEQKLEEAADRLIAHCLVHPPKPEYAQLVEKFPAVPGLLVGLIGKLATGGAATGE